MYFHMYLVYILPVTLIYILAYFIHISNYWSDRISAVYEPGSVSYDYIVVGAGSAGSIVASRLAENSNDTILLIEAGGNSLSVFDIPIMSPLLQSTVQDWQYKTVPQIYSCYALEDNSSIWPRGKVVGGSSCINYMLYVRGHIQDYKLWNEENKEWDLDAILSYFKKSEKQTGRYKKSSYHSRHGRSVVSDLYHKTPLANAFVTAGVELGFSNNDLNDMKQTGFMEAQVNIHEGRRQNVAKSFLVDIKKNNINILTNSLVKKVMFYSNYEAKGVVVVRFNKEFKYYARKAIVLSAGAIGSPEILLRSGIGPKEHLKSLKIPVILDLAVGRNLQDHITTGLDLILLNQSLSLNFGDITSLDSLWKYMQYGKGPWTITGCEAMSVLYSPQASKNGSPDLQIMALPMGLSSDYGSHMKGVIGIKEDVWKEYFAPLQGRQVVSLLPVLLHPKSVGDIKLRSKDVFDGPIINPNYLGESDDIDILYEGVQFVKKIINTQAMKNLGAHLYNKSFPGCTEYIFDSPSYWKCYIKHLTVTSFHPVGTCKMGPSSDPSSVVNSHLRVHGTNKLFVIDASIMPSLPSGNINAAVMMIAERGADFVKKFTYQATYHCQKNDIFVKKSCNRF